MALTATNIVPASLFCVAHNMPHVPIWATR
jgi:hypothetical protein